MFTNPYNAYFFYKAKNKPFEKRLKPSEAYDKALEIIRVNADRFMTLERWMEIRMLFNRK
jgi:hypothetical protein